MNYRISTGMMYQQSINTMLAKQAKLAHTQQQLSSGQRLVTAKDDPVAAGTAVGLDRAVAELERFGMNASAVQNRLGLQENALTQVGDAMARVNELVIQANNAAMGDDSRQAISTELKSIYAGLLDLANSTDGAGRYLFGGTSDGSAPFAIAGGNVIYSGDQTQRQVEVAPDMFVADTLPGSEVFLRLRTGDGRIDGQPAAGNTGTGLLMGFSVTDSTAWDGDTYTLSFGAGNTYQVVDGGGAVVATGAYAKGESIAFAGVQMKIDGQPANGDSFTLGPAGSRDIFATVQGLIDTLETSPTTDTQRAVMQNSLQAAMRDIATAQSRMIDARASGGAQLSAIDDAAALREANNVTLQGTLSTLRDLDWAEAIGRYQMENTALQAAQTVFMQMQSLSLFKLMG
ncbi:flagellar hook-associated protein FlgL [Pseudoxanthomonas sp. PXM03]|jgi:flagellar hook-associated protein 3 FlgL|uniref:flagellar hook-associated protein FlgL n=1 Tax=unclassified Pseudoxanthomonas TaxID=2645906 RepID=UPI001782FDF6|nr:flagellar hook-associated protein FlgL [Pseudoxanthomonas sp. PXM03]MBD9437554.1 flagellar hook-associated protein FlgL [Pseudoxanthomonas sp. PXM03]